MDIFERFERQETEDLIIIGDKMEKFINSDIGRLICNKMLPNLQKMELLASRTGAANADRALGRIEAYDTILSDIETFVTKKKELQRPIEREDFDQDLAEEQTSIPVRGGQI